MEIDGTKTARDVIDRDLRQLKTLLTTNRFDKVKYQSDGKGGLGSGALRVGDEVTNTSHHTAQTPDDLFALLWLILRLTML